MARRRGRAEILVEIEGLKKQLAESEDREERRVGRIANKAGLLDVEIDDEELTKVLSDLAARFRGQGKAAPLPSAAVGTADPSQQSVVGAGGSDRD